MSSRCIYEVRRDEYEYRVYAHEHGYSAFESRKLGYARTMDKAIALCQRRRRGLSPSMKLLITFLLAFISVLVLKFWRLLF